MKDYLYSDFISEEKIYIDNIPAILFKPTKNKEKSPTIIFYYGWSSKKESHRMEGLILATVGFQVLIPDCINHGERNPIDYKKNTHLFWKMVFNNLEESNLLLEELINKYDADKDNISLIGHSMGGFSVSGIFTHNPRFKSAVILNGSCAWEYFNEILKKQLNIEMTEKLYKIEEKVKELDPFKKLELLVDRPILMLHGQSDSLVSIENQRLFFEKIQPLYKDKEKIKFIEYPYLNHFITTNMMEESIIWFKKYGI